MSRPVVKHREHVAEHRSTSPDLSTVRGFVARPSKELPEELIGPINEMHNHGAIMPEALLQRRPSGAREMPNGVCPG